MKKYNIKISIIVATLNKKNDLEKTILSVVNQTYSNIELIIIDGGSSDGSINVLKKYDKNIKFWCSEPDKGISNAFNKGLLKATGDYINFQGAGDILDHEDILLNLFGNKEYTNKLICGKIKRVNKDGSILWQTNIPSNLVFKKELLKYNMCLPHQALFTSKEYFKLYGTFDENLVYSMDYDHLLRSFNSNFDILLLDAVISRWLNDGLGNGKEIEIYREYLNIKLKNKISNIFYLYIIHLFILCKFYIKKIIQIFTNV